MAVKRRRREFRAEDDEVDQSEEYLRSAQPHLTCRIDFRGEREPKVTPYIREAGPDCDQVIREGYDPDHSPLGPVYYRIVQRGEEQLYCSTFLATRAFVINAWGTKGLAYCDPITGIAVARVETNLRGEPPSSMMDDRVREGAAFRDATGVPPTD
jgi:hypothetical protein